MEGRVGGRCERGRVEDRLKARYVHYLGMRGGFRSGTIYEGHIADCCQLKRELLFTKALGRDVGGKSSHLPQSQTTIPAPVAR